MLSKLTVFTWIVFMSFFSVLYYILNFHPQMVPYELSPIPGRTLSMYLGTIGFFFMVLLLAYVVRKRVTFLNDYGKIKNWLDFHILCGLLGPTLILFHCNFKVRGLVGISFWSMIISVLSGIIGKYFYLQILGQTHDYRGKSEAYWTKFLSYIQRYKIDCTESEVKKLRAQTLHFVGAPAIAELNSFDQHTSLVKIFILSIVGDLRLSFTYPQAFPNMPKKARVVLSEFGVNFRRALFFSKFQRMMGHWHTFHLPFAIFMYIAAIIHIFSSLIFRVNF